MYNYSGTVFNYKFEVLVLYLSFSILFKFELPLHHMSEANIALFSPLQEMKWIFRNPLGLAGKHIFTKLKAERFSELVKS